MDPSLEDPLYRELQCEDSVSGGVAQPQPDIGQIQRKKKGDN